MRLGADGAPPLRPLPFDFAVMVRLRLKNYNIICITKGLRRIYRKFYYENNETSTMCRIGFGRFVKKRKSVEDI